MAFPRKYQRLLELERESKPAPPQAWLTYSVCGVTQNACGWHGWILEAVFDTAEPTIGPEHLESGAYNVKCPNCGADLFRTGASYRYEPSVDQTPVLRPGVDYEVEPMEFDD